MATDSIALPLVKHPADLHSSSVLVYQKHVVTTFDELAVGWQGHDRLGAGWAHPF